MNRQPFELTTRFLLAEIRGRLHARSLQDRRSTVGTSRYASSNCPKCKASFLLSGATQIDSSSFESFSLRCLKCDSAIGGIVEPISKELLFSLPEPIDRTTAD